MHLYGNSGSFNPLASSLLSSLPWPETHKCVAAVPDPESTSSSFQAPSLPRLIQGIISLCWDRLSKTFCGTSPVHVVEGCCQNLTPKASVLGGSWPAVLL